MKKDIKQLLTEYGSVALVVYLTIFVAVLAGFWAAIRLGWRTESTAGAAGTLAAAYVATKLTQPLRIAATLVLTPVVAKVYEKVRPRRANGVGASLDPESEKVIRGEKGDKA